MIKIEFPADRPDLARAFGEALTRIGAGEPTPWQTLGGADPDTVANTVAADAEFERLFERPKSSEAAELGEGTSADGVALTAASTSPDPSPTTARVDQHGVAFDPAFCAEAAEPFYATGKQSGQWKKRRGVDEADYVKWYESQLAVAPEPESEPEAGSITDAPSLFVWVSEMQTAGRLTQDDVAAAWQAAGVTSPTQLFADDAAPLVASIYQYLSARA